MLSHRIAGTLLVGIGVASTGVVGAEEYDAFDYLAEANKASLVMLVETGLVSHAQGGEIARAVARIIDEQGREGARRSANYLDFEQRLIELGGEEASRIHIGRSRQDLHGTARRMQVRAAVLSSLTAMLGARQALLDLAAANPDIAIPAYTHGVQAQPTSLGHYLLAFASAFERDTDRLLALWPRVNRSPLGAGPLGTSAFPLDRERLAELLGFLGPIENAFDANFIASMDAKVELANALALSAVHVAQFVENLHTQYHDPAPWFLLGDGETSISTSMPQKRNPRPLDRIRTDATAVVGGAHLVLLYAHNTNTGMHDYRPTGPVLEVVEHAMSMYTRYARVVGGLRIDRARALKDLGDEYATMTEVADTLVRLRRRSLPRRAPLRVGAGKPRPQPGQARGRVRRRRAEGDLWRGTRRGVARRPRSHPPRHGSRGDGRQPPGPRRLAARVGPQDARTTPTFACEDARLAGGNPHWSPRRPPNP